MLLTQAPGEEGEPTVDAILTGLMEALQIGAAGNPLILNHRQPATMQGDIATGFIHFEEWRVPNWTFDQGLTDVTHHLAVVCRRGKYVILCFSDGGIRAGAAAAVGKANLSGFSHLTLLPLGILNSAFVRGRARTLWLAGTHRRTTTKADSKVLSGADLRAALDPLGDQTYSFTAARSDLVLGEMRQEKVGVAPRNSSIWAGPSTGWPDFLRFSEILFVQLENTVPVDAPLPVLAVSSSELTAVKDAFDLAFSPPELLLDAPDLAGPDRAQIEYWALHTTFEVIPNPDTAHVDANVTIDGEALGTVHIDLEPQRRKIVPRVNGESLSQDTSPKLAEVMKKCRTTGWLKIWYTSSHTFMDDQVFFTRFREFPFQGFEWCEFAGFNVGKEKPSKDEITHENKPIGTDDSLFCWVLKHWPNLDGSTTQPGGWLACDDGAGEMADFVHFDEVTRKLSLLHVKASSSLSPAREVSVSDYELVTSQAEKNLRFVDSGIAIGSLRAGLEHKIAASVWHDRQPTTRGEMLAYLDTLGANYSRQLVIVQPRLTRTRLERARAAPNTVEGLRLRQLDTLLLSAGASAGTIGTVLRVIVHAV